MERILRGTAATISVTFYLDGTATDPSPDSATVEVLRSDGTQLVAATSATNAGVGKFTFQLTPTHSALLDVLTARWTATIGGQAQTLETEVEIAGGFYFSIAELRAKYPDVADPTEFPAAAIAEERATAEDTIERACSVAFVPRMRREAFTAPVMPVNSYASTDWYGRPQGGAWRNLNDLFLGRSAVRTIRSVTVDGAPLASQDLAALVLHDGRWLYRPTGWLPSSTGTPDNIVVTYEHGLDSPPRRIRDAAMLLAQVRLVGDDLSPRATRVRIRHVGDVALADPTAPGAVTGIPEVDAAIEAYDRTSSFLRLR
jgi:hypothetical protein